MAGFIDCGSGEQADIYEDLHAAGGLRYRSVGSATAWNEAKVARQSVEGYVMDKNLPGFTEAEHLAMEEAGKTDGGGTVEDVREIVLRYFQREILSNDELAKPRGQEVLVSYRLVRPDGYDDGDLLERLIVGTGEFDYYELQLNPGNPFKADLPDSVLKFCTEVEARRCVELQKARGVKGFLRLIAWKMKDNVGRGVDLVNEVLR